MAHAHEYESALQTASTYRSAIKDAQDLLAARADQIEALCSSGAELVRLAEEQEHRRNVAATFASMPPTALLRDDAYYREPSYREPPQVEPLEMLPERTIVRKEVTTKIGF